MPAYNMHLLGGFVTFFPLFILLSFKGGTQAAYMQWMFWCLFGSLFPDIDTKSHIQKWFYILVIATLCLFNIKFSWIFLLLLLPLLVRHRGLFHSPKFILLLSMLFIFICQYTQLPNYQIHSISVLFFLAGAYSHLILDLGFKKFSARLLKR